MILEPNTSVRRAMSSGVPRIPASVYPFTSVTLSSLTFVIIVTTTTTTTTTITVALTTN